MAVADAVRGACHSETMKKPILVGGVVAALVVAGGVAWFVSTLDDQTEAKTDDVLSDFRAQAGPARQGQAGLPPQGVYQYRVKGREKIVRGITIERTLPDTAPMMLLHREGGYETKTLYSAEHTEEAVFALKPDGAYLTKAVTRISVGPVRNVVERDWKPQLLRIPTGAHAPWGGNHQTGTITMAVKATQRPAEDVTVGTQTVKANVYRFDQQATGEYTGTRVEQFWVDPKTHLVVRYTIDSSLKGPTDLDFEVDETLTSLEPRT